MNEKEQELTFKNFFLPFTTKKAIIFIIIIGFVVYLNGLFNDFLGDDLLQIVNNVQAHSITNISNFFFGGTFYNGFARSLIGVYYKPFFVAILTLLYYLFGANAFWFHLAQLFIHIINTILLFLLFKHFFKKSTSFVLSLIFLVHPINSQSVLFISALQEPLFFFFGILAFWLITKFNEIKYYIFASILLLFSLFSKETGILFLGCTSFYTLLFKKRHFLFLLTPLIIISVIYFVLRINAVGFAGNPHATPIDNLSLGLRILNIPAIIFFYLKTFLYPVSLSFTNNWAYETFSFSNFLLPLGIELALLTADLYFAIILYKKLSKAYFRCFLFFNFLVLIGFLLHLQIIPLDMIVSESWFYFPIVGFLGILGVLYETILPKINKRLMLIIALTILTSLSVRTIIRSFDWRSETILYYKDLEVNKDNYIAGSNIAYMLYQQGKLNEAKRLVESSINRYPRALSYNTLGLIYFEEGNYQKAKEAYLNGLKRGGFQLQYEAMAQLDIFYGNPNENIKIVEYGVQKYPQDADLWKFLALLEYKQGHIKEAKEAITQAYKLDNSELMGIFYDRIMNNKKLILKAKNL